MKLREHKRAGALSAGVLLLLISNLMNKEQIEAVKEIVLSLQETGALDGVDWQKTLISILLIVVAALSVRIFVINGMGKKIISYIDRAEKMKEEALVLHKQTNETLETLKNMEKTLHLKVNHLLEKQGIRRKTDYIDPQFLDTGKFTHTE